MQQGQPIPFASRELTDRETSYAQIDKEMLAIVLAAEKFDRYTFGQRATGHSDHKPLESIWNKPLFSARNRLQVMIVRLLWYNLDIVYTQGKLLYLAGTLSRAFLSINQVNGPHDGLDHISIKDYTSSDEHLQQLRAVIVDGWPTCELNELINKCTN